MPRNHRGFLCNQFAFNYMQVGAADAAAGNAHQYFATDGLRDRNVRKHQGIALDQR
jgi:hypothetical protein